VAEPREEMDALLSALIEVSQELLERQGEFYPHGATINASGDFALAGAYVGEEFPASTELVELLYEGFRQQAVADEIRAAAIAADVRVAAPGSDEPGDAIRVSIEHAQADPVQVFLPYTKRRLRGVEYGELFASAAEPRIFGPEVRD
jgi:hypothetical protein